LWFFVPDSLISIDFLIYLKVIRHFLQQKKIVSKKGNHLLDLAERKLKMLSSMKLMTAEIHRKKLIKL